MNKTTFGLLHCIAGNFLTIRRKIFNLKIFVLILKFNKCRVRGFAPSPVRVLDQFLHSKRFFSPYRYSKNLSPCGKFNDIDRCKTSTKTCNFHSEGTG
jgi:hypothetical protein